jgi:hypothetical protein
MFHVPSILQSMLVQAMVAIEGIIILLLMMALIVGQPAAAAADRAALQSAQTSMAVRAQTPGPAPIRCPVSVRC